jgi:hypothetical protein
MRRKDHPVKHRISNVSMRGTAAATAVAAAAAAVTVGLVAWPADGESRTTEPAASRFAPAVGGSATIAGRSPAQARDDVLKERQHRKAAAAARQAREQRDRAARSASRSVAYDGNPQRIAASMMAERYGWGAGEFACLSSLWERESSWEVHASNPSSGAYGIPQALPGSKMSAYGADWQDNAVTQIEWGLAYINQSYGTPCGAWSTFRSQGWY